jgi:hypothetical protein
MHHLKKDLHTCGSCGLVSSDIMPETAIYDRSYTIKYSRYEKTEIGQEIQKYRRNVVKMFVDSGPLLDFGCSVGSFLKVCDEGLDAHGFDINPYSGFTDVTTLLKKYNIVTMWDSLEHVRDPVELINCLGPKWLFICTPSTDDCGGGDLTEWRHYMPSEHCHYFNKNSLAKMLGVCGYKHIFTDYGESKLRRGGGDKNIITVAGEKA